MREVLDSLEVGFGRAAGATEDQSMVRFPQVRNGSGTRKAASERGTDHRRRAWLPPHLEPCWSAWLGAQLRELGSLPCGRRRAGGCRREGWGRIDKSDELGVGAGGKDATQAGGMERTLRMEGVETCVCVCSRRFCVVCRDGESRSKRWYLDGRCGCWHPKVRTLSMLVPDTPPETLDDSNDLAQSRTRPRLYSLSSASRAKERPTAAPPFPAIPGRTARACQEPRPSPSLPLLPSHVRRPFLSLSSAAAEADSRLFPFASAWQGVTHTG